jgi:hypothetical protein
MAAADAVLSDPNLANLIFLQIGDRHPQVAGRALANWRAVNHVVRTATEADARAKWAALLRDGYKGMLMADKAKLATALIADGQHPLVHIKMLHKAFPYTISGPGAKRACLRVHFVSDMITQYHLQKRDPNAKIRGLSMSKWIDAQWDALEPWKQAVYLTCHLDEDVRTMGWRRGERAAQERHRIGHWDPVRSNQTFAEILANFGLA